MAAMASKLKADLGGMVNEIQATIELADFTPKDYNPPRCTLFSKQLC